MNDEDNICSLFDEFRETLRERFPHWKRHRLCLKSVTPGDTRIDQDWDSKNDPSWD